MCDGCEAMSSLKFSNNILKFMIYNIFLNLLLFINFTELVSMIPLDVNILAKSIEVGLNKALCNLCWSKNFEIINDFFNI